MTNQQGAPEALRLADRLSSNTGHVGGPTMDAAASELRRLHFENERLAALVEAQQPAPSAAPEHAETMRRIGEGQAFEAWFKVDCPVEGLNARIAAKAAWQARAALDAPQPSPTPQADSQPAPVLDETLKHALWLASSFAIHRYLMSNAEGRWDGAEKATRHGELCSLYVAVFRGGEVDMARRDWSEDWAAVHDTTQALTDNLDEVIGFPLKGRPDYNVLAPKFFNHFHHRATAALGAARAPADSVTAPAATVIKKGADRQWMSERLGHLPDGIYSLYLAPPAHAADSVLEDAARYRFLAGHCRSTSEHWGGRWSIIVDGPAPKSHDSENDFDEAVDAARKQGANHD